MMSVPSFEGRQAGDTVLFGVLFPGGNAAICYSFTSVKIW